MMVPRGRPPRTGLLVVAALLGSVLLGGIHSARAQGGSPPAAFSAGTAVEVGDSWRVTVGAATIHAVPPDAEPTAPPALLATSLTVQNLATQPRHFPTYRVHVLSASGAAFQDAWCRGVDQALELVPAIPPDATATGALCWKYPSADTAQVIVAMDPAGGSTPDQRVAFALDPVISTASRSAATPAPSPAPLLQGNGDAPDRGGVGVSAPSGAQCSSAYAYSANSSGSYSTCPTGSTRGGASSGAALQGTGAPACQLYPSGTQPSGSFIDTSPGLYYQQCAGSAPSSWNAGVSPCQLYPSASQLSSSSTTNHGSGIPLEAPASTAPPCPLAGGGGTRSVNGGAPACRLYPSGSQPSTSTFAVPPFSANFFGLTPVALPTTVPTPPGGMLAGSIC
jgi:hypothetical protein